MKYPFQKKSFWIILIISYLIIVIFPPSVDLSWHGSGLTLWQFFSDIPYDHPIEVRVLIFEMIIAFLLNYLGHLIFSKPEKKYNYTNKEEKGVTE
jgi:hypothetical protein